MRGTAPQTGGCRRHTSPRPGSRLEWLRCPVSCLLQQSGKEGGGEEGDSSEHNDTHLIHLPICLSAGWKTQGISAKVWHSLHKLYTGFVLRVEGTKIFAKSIHTAVGKAMSDSSPKNTSVCAGRINCSCWARRKRLRCSSFVGAGCQSDCAAHPHHFCPSS